jgi:hypothetical protein
VIGANPPKDWELKDPGPFSRGSVRLAFCLSVGINMAVTLTSVVGRVTALSRTLRVNILMACHALGAKRRRRAQNELEQRLSDSSDRFELERRERAWNRWQPGDGSLLGR